MLILVFNHKCKIESLGGQKMKKFISILLLVMVLVTGCTNVDTSNSDSSSNLKNSEINIPMKIGVIQLVDHTSLNLIYEAFFNQMINLGYEKEQIELINANGDMVNVENAVNKLQADEVDVAVAITTPVAQYALKLADQIPVIFSAVSDPVQAGLVTDLTITDKNISGTSDAVSVKSIMNLAMIFNPQAKKVGYIYNPGEANSIVNLEKLKKYCEKHKLEIEEASIMSSADLQTATAVLASKVDFIFVANDNTVAEAMQVVASEALKAGLQVYVGADSMVMDGGFATVGINYEDLGIETANMVDAVLKGEDIMDMPVKVFDDDLFIYVNKNTAEALGVDIPEEILLNDKYVEISR